MISTGYAQWEGKAVPTISALAHDIQYSGPVDEVAAALAFHDGDVRATIGALIDDCRHLRQQLALTQVAMSIGFTRAGRRASKGKSRSEGNERRGDPHCTGSTRAFRALVRSTWVREVGIVRERARPPDNGVALR
jgi:hypothetical protein